MSKLTTDKREAYRAASMRQLSFLYALKQREWTVISPAKDYQNVLKRALLGLYIYHINLEWH